VYAVSLVDQIVIADTGSTDNTIAVARECGATVITCLWTDHYADARNIALAPMTTLVRWEARQDYHRITSLAVQEAPLNTHLWLQMGISEITARKNVRAALECFEHAVRIDSECFDAWRSASSTKAQRSYVSAI
jgi:glycosyltransferase involved in cell wall biosynthesis